MTLTHKIFYGLLLVALIGPLYAEDRALLVGIDKYQYVSELRGSKQDVADMLQFVQTVWGYKPYQIRTLTDARATRQGILTAFERWLIGGTQSGDRVLFYFSGHGFYTKDYNRDESDGYDEALCPVNTQGTRDTMILDDEINALLRRLNGRNVTVVIDACHSGTVTRSLARRSPNNTIKIPIFSPPKWTLSRSLSTRGLVEPDGFVTTAQNVVAYTAVAPNQVALVDVEKPYRGVFTRRFIEAIQEKRADSNYDGKVSHAEVLEYVRKESQAYCDRNRYQCQAGQLSPQLETQPEMLAVDARTGKAPVTNNTAEQVTNVLPHTNDAELDVKMLPGQDFQVGDTMKIRVRSEHDGYLLVFDINSAGELTRIFPNQYSERQDKYGLVKKGQTLTIPDPFYGFDFVAEEPLGKGLLVAVLIEDELSMVQKLLPKAFEQVPSKEVPAVLQKLRQQLDYSLQQGDNRANRPVRWSIGVIEYQIIPGGRGVRG